MFHTDLHLLARVAVGFAISYAIGFERQLRGSPAGDRTFTLIGTAATAVTASVYLTSPQAVAGILTGIGFIGAGLVFVHGSSVRGLTSAATVFAVAGVGIVVGYGNIFLGIVVGAVFLLVLEIQHIPGIRTLDARTYEDRFKNDITEPPVPSGPDPGDNPSNPSA